MASVIRRRLPLHIPHNLCTLSKPKAMDIFFSILAAAVVFTIFFFISNRQLRKKNLPPSPSSSLPIFGHLHLLKKPLHRSLAVLSSHYGPALYLRFGSRPVLLISSSSLAEDCLSRNDVIFANRPRLLFSKLLGFNYSAIGSSSYGPHWRNLRRVATAEILSSFRVQSLSAIRAQEVQSLLRGLFRDSEEGKCIAELKSKFSELTFNIMMGMIAEKRYYGENIVNLEEAKRFRRIVKESVAVSGASNIGDFVPFFRWFDFGGIKKRLIRLAEDRNEFLQGLIDQQLQKKKMNDEISSVADETQGRKKKNLIEVLLSLREAEPEYYTDSVIMGIIAAMLTAGTDTSSLTMEWAMVFLLNHPHVLEKAKAELDMQVGDRLLEDSDLSSLPYLHCVINETLRLCPVAPLLLPHESSEDTTVGGFHVPGNTMLLINAWAIHRDPKVWEDPDDFKPERFEGSEVGKEGCKFIPFGHGRRGCPGEGLAVKVVGLALGSLIQCFEWERVGEEMIDVKEGPGLTMPKALPLEATFKPRPNMIGKLSQL